MRSEAHLQGLLDWVNVVADADADSLLELGDGVVLGRALCRLQTGRNTDQDAKLTTLSAVTHTLERELRLKRKGVVPCDQHDADKLADVVQFMLALAVQGKFKEECVKEIMELDPAVQHFIMLEVDNALKACARINATPVTPSPLKVSKTPPKRVVRENEALKADNEQLLTENSSLQKLLQEAEQQINQLRQESKEALLRKEMAMDQAFEDHKANLVAKLSDKDQQIASLGATIEALQRENQQVAILRDQLEVVGAQAQDAERKDATIRKLREKIDTVGDLNAHIQDLQQTNKALLDRSLAAEQEAATIPRLRADLDQYKRALTQAQLASNEAKALLNEKQGQCEAIQAKLHGAVEIVALQQQQQQEQQRKLEVDAEDDELTDQVTLGISELNPAIRENLQRLEQENAMLKAQLAENSPESLAKLRFEHESAQSVNSALQRELASRKAEIKRNKNCIAALQRKLDHLVRQQVAVELATATVETVFQENFVCRARRTIEAEAEAHRATKAQMLEYQQQHSTSNQQLEQKLHQESLRVRDAQQETDRFQLRANELQHQVTQLRRQLKSAQVQRIGHAAAPGASHDDLITEIQRLRAHNEQLASDMQTHQNNTLEASSSSAPVAVGATEMFRNFQSQVQTLQKENHRLSMAKTSELLVRKEVESKLAQLQKQFDDLDATNTSLRLKLERLRSTKENIAPSKPSKTPKPAIIQDQDQHKQEESCQQQ